MNELTNALNQLELSEVGEEIERLFALQDKHLTEKKKSVILNELSGTGYPYGAIMAGIRSLVAENMGDIKFFHLRAAIEKFITREKPTGERCEGCNGRGFVVVHDPGGRPFALACRCNTVNHGLVKWAGQDSQMSSRRTSFGDYEDRILTRSA